MVLTEFFLFPILTTNGLRQIFKSPSIYMYIKLHLVNSFTNAETIKRIIPQQC